ncbi:hypothetical protein V2J09_009621 [Rumex salicifolius]
MLPSLSLTSSPNSATVKVEKATSELLIGPDWTMNMEICDSVNSDHWMAKEVVKSAKKRLQHKSPRVQMLTLTLLETMVKNCGEQVHFHIAERKVLDEMIKIVKKRTDMEVRSKVLVLLDSWQEAFGGPGGKHMQYYWAYDELRRSGVQFPPRSLEAAPIITPPATQPSTGHPQIGYGMPNNSSRRLDVAMASDSESLSISAMESMQSAMELLSDMLQAVNPSDQMSVKDEVIVDVVDRCRSNQKKLAQMLTTTTDEELLFQGLELNDGMQTVLAKHDAIASASPLPTHLTSSTSSHPNDSPTSNVKPNDPIAESSSPATVAKPAPTVDSMKNPALREEEEEEDDEFAQLARRHSKPSPMPARSEDATSSSAPSELSNALVLADPHAPEMAPKEQDMADFLSIVLSTSYTSEPEPTSQTPNPVPEQNNNYIENHVEPTFNSYVAPWSQAQPQQQQTSAYPPPPWASTPGYPNAQMTTNNQYMYSIPQETNNGSMPMQGLHQHSFQNPQPVNQAAVNSASMAGRTLQHTNSFPASSNNANTAMSAPTGQKPYVPSYRLFEDLNVFGTAEGKTRSGPYSSSSGNSGQSAVGGSLQKIVEDVITVV